MQKGERGFFLIDAVVLAAIVAAMAGSMGMYLLSTKVRQEEGIMRSAVYLADSQMAYLERLAYLGELDNGEIEWLGLPEDLRQHGTEYRVATEVASEGTSLQRARVTVSWEALGKQDKVELERLMRAYE